MQDLKETEIEKLRQIISRTDKSGNEKLLLLMDFIYTREAALRIADVMLSLPSDGETEKWFEENIGTVNDCSASSAIYKFRLWLKERGKSNEA